ncbi:MAG: 4-alpha-glucanotransferase [Burkholderiales bacterium]|nr:4-alpha-glucanotransferase [Burkholderiales bacterium]
MRVFEDPTCVSPPQRHLAAPHVLARPAWLGRLRPSAYHFVDWLVAGGQKLWQILPLVNIGLGDSPYMSSSAFAGNVLMIDLAELHTRGWLSADDLVPEPGLSDTAVNFCGHGAVPHGAARTRRAPVRPECNPARTRRTGGLCAEHTSWLDNYALFMAISEHHDQRSWTDWAPALATRQPAALAAAAKQHGERIQFWIFCQWCFFRQWARLRAYANQRGVQIVGDAPIFIAHNSAECWARPELFELDTAGQPTVVAGVPPDAFSATGQRWGNPLYRWSAHASEGYAWWIERVRRIFELVDIVRIDHFRGFAGYWEIPASEPTAMNGRWVPGPGPALFKAIAGALGPLPIIAEDLGVITPDVDALRTEFDFPGMRILQFAWGEQLAAESRFLPHNHTHDSVVYTGSHDNNTTLGWWADASEDERNHLREYLACDGRAVNWDLIRAASASVADTAVHPMQDVINLGAEHRMNFPGTAAGNWGWRYTWAMMAPDTADRLRRYGQLYGRL